MCMALTFALQALLVRHEAYMAGATAKRLRMEGSITKLQREKQELEMSNAQMIKENRELLDQLESLSSGAVDSDAQIKSLTSTLQSTNEELHRLSILAARATDLESQMLDLETEQAKLQEELATSKEDNQSAIQRWKRAEGTVGYLQEQIDRIEREASEERARHVEIVGRMERRRVVEKELDSAAGRLKGAAASKSLQQNGNTAVVSHFVRDILADNANLQMGVVELREMLLGSHAEVETLREQLLLHQPLERPEQLRHNSLGTELETTKEQEEEETGNDHVPNLHVHHHYHAPKRTVRKAKKKRPSLAASHFTPSLSGASTPSNRRIREWQEDTPPTSTSAILSQTLATMPKRWSMQSTQSASTVAPSTVSSSPSQTPAVFDNIDEVSGSSRPVTPASSLTASPPSSLPDHYIARYSTQRTVSAPAMRPLGLPLLNLKTKVKASVGFSKAAAPSLLPGFPTKTGPETLDSSNSTSDRRTMHAPRSSRVSSSELMSPLGQEIILEVPDEALERAQCSDSNRSNHASGNENLSPNASILEPDFLQSPPLRRSRSSDSLLSIAGMDIHAPLRPQASQVFSGRGFTPMIASSPTAATTITPTQTDATITPTAATAPRPLRHQRSSDEYTRALLSRKTSRPSLGKAVGGWVWGKWGVPSPTASSTPATPATPALAKERRAFPRAPGVNQSGVVSGLLPPLRVPTSVQPACIDEEALREGLAED